MNIFLISIIVILTKINVVQGNGNKNITIWGRIKCINGNEITHSYVALKEKILLFSKRRAVVNLVDKNFYLSTLTCLNFELKLVQKILFKLSFKAVT